MYDIRDDTNLLQIPILFFQWARGSQKERGHIVWLMSYKTIISMNSSPIIYTNL